MPASPRGPTPRLPNGLGGGDGEPLIAGVVVAEAVDPQLAGVPSRSRRRPKQGRWAGCALEVPVRAPPMRPRMLGTSSARSSKSRSGWRSRARSRPGVHRSFAISRQETSAGSPALRRVAILPKRGAGSQVRGIAPSGPIRRGPLGRPRTHVSGRPRGNLAAAVDVTPLTFCATRLYRTYSRRVVSISDVFHQPVLRIEDPQSWLAEAPFLTPSTRQNHSSSGARQSSTRTSGSVPVRDLEASQPDPARSGWVRTSTAQPWIVPSALA